MFSEIKKKKKKPKLPSQRGEEGIQKLREMGMLEHPVPLTP